MSEYNKNVPIFIIGNNIKYNIAVNIIHMQPMKHKIEYFVNNSFNVSIFLIVFCLLGVGRNNCLILIVKMMLCSVQKHN